MEFQKSLKERVACSGVGLHSGKPVRMVLAPAPPGTGIVFRRTDLPKGFEIKAEWLNVVDTSFATTLGCNGHQVATVEHLLAAIYSLGIDNLVVEIDSGEVPIMDGSAQEFVLMLQKAGLLLQDEPARYIRLIRPVKVSEGDREAALFPADDFQISLVIEYDHPLIGIQSYSAVISQEMFEQEVCRARTFGFLSEVEGLKAQGLARGGSLGNAVVVGREAILNQEGLRFPDEFVRHKVLDCLGDLSLFGLPLKAHYQAYKPGHSLNHKLLGLVLADGRNFIVAESFGLSHRSFHVPLGALASG